MQNHTELLVKLIERLEERNWEYSITHDNRFETYLGNYFYNVSKFDIKELQQIIDDIDQW